MFPLPNAPTDFLPTHIRNWAPAKFLRRIFVSKYLTYPLLYDFVLSIILKFVHRFMSLRTYGQSKLFYINGDVFFSLPMPDAPAFHILPPTGIFFY